MNTLSLDGAWVLFSNEQPTRRLQADLPGDNYSALIAAGLCPDPYYGKNENDVQCFRYEHWNWEREFQITEELYSYKYIYMELSMVDTFCTVYVNGQAACECGNAFVEYRPEIKKHLHVGANSIRFAFRPIDAEAERIANVRGGNYPHIDDCRVKHLNQVRKSFCSGGWDWGITLAANGVYQPIRLVGRSNASIRSINAKQEHLAGEVIVTAIAEITAEEAGRENVSFSFNGEKRIETVSLQCGDNVVQTSFRVKNPRLWWPNGLGAQELYTLTVETGEEAQSRQIGLRKLEVVNEKDEFGTSLIFRVNGIDVFAKGADWIPCDAIPTRQTVERYENLLESARAANMNMLRVWGGGQYERDCFYEICDKKGLLVWQDMMFSCAVYPADDAFAAEVKRELDYQIRRLRSHACLAIWCGDNECLGALKWWPPEEEYAPRLENFKRLNAVLAAKVKELDDGRIFWPSSPCGGPGNFKDGWHNDQDGDMHYWEVWHGGKDFSAYYDVKPRFCSEFGYQSFPSLETVATFCPKEGYDVLSAVMRHHQKCHLGNEPILKMFGKYFRQPKGFENFLYLSQVQQALAIKTGVEYWRTLKPRCMGTIFWQFNDNWPVASWSSVEYGGKWKLLQYEAKRFYSPVIAVMLKTKDGAFELYAVSDLPMESSIEITLDCRMLDGSVAAVHSQQATLAAGESRMLHRYGIAQFANADFIEIKTNSEGGIVHRNTFFFKQFCDMELPDAEIKAEISNDVIALTTDAPAFFVALDAPCLFSENNFTLLPDEMRLIRFFGEPSALTIRHLRQTY